MINHIWWVCLWMRPNAIINNCSEGVAWSTESLHSCIIVHTLTTVRKMKVSISGVCSVTPRGQTRPENRIVPKTILNVMNVMNADWWIRPGGFFSGIIFLWLQSRFYEHNKNKIINCEFLTTEPKPIKIKWRFYNIIYNISTIICSGLLSLLYIDTIVKQMNPMIFVAR